MARSMVSRVMLAVSAALTAARSRGFMAGSGRPDLAERVISRISLAKAWAFLAPWAALRCMMFLACEWPAIAALRSLQIAVEEGLIAARAGGRHRQASGSAGRRRRICCLRNVPDDRTAPQ